VAKWLYAFLILAITTIGIALILKFGYEPAPVNVMSPSFFESPERVGAALIRRFYSPVAQDKVIAIGIPPQPDWQRKVVKGFLEAALAEKVPFDAIVAEAQMPPLDLSGLPPIEVHSVQMNSATQSEFIDRVRELRTAGKRVLIYSASVFTSHILPGNPIDRYEKMAGERVLTISSGPLPLKSDQEYLIEPPCRGSEVDKDGVAPLGCAFLKAGRLLYRKHIAQDKFVAIMNSPKPNDFLLMISSPGQGSKTPEAPH